MMKSVKPAGSINEFSDPKEMILMHINNIPGIRYRELLRLTRLSNGVVEYHLSALEKSCHIRVDRQKENRTTRFYSISIPTQESELLGQLRGDVSRQIIKFILEHDLCTFIEIAEHLHKASSTVSWHLKRLKKAGLISVKYGGEYQLYQIMNPRLVADILFKYKESFVDAAVSNYTQIVEEL
jgi:predicted transcriptional regulator